jgi:hypothetical protein
MEYLGMVVGESCFGGEEKWWLGEKCVEEKGIEPLTFRMRSEHSTTELHPRDSADMQYNI